MLTGGQNHGISDMLKKTEYAAKTPFCGGGGGGGGIMKKSSRTLYKGVLDFDLQPLPRI